MDDSDRSVENLLDDIGFDPEQNVLTRRQAEVLALRQQNLSQEEIASVLGTTRANISSIESSARRNVSRARETVAIAQALEAPIQIRIDEGTDLFDIPEIVFTACDDAEKKVAYTSAELIQQIRDAARDSIEADVIKTPLMIGVDAEGSVTIRTATQ